jgi:hypothetical protein
MQEENEPTEKFKNFLAEFGKIKEMDEQYQRQKELLLKEADELALLNQKFDWDRIPPRQKAQLDKIKEDFNNEMQRIETDFSRKKSSGIHAGRRIEV